MNGVQVELVTKHGDLGVDFDSILGFHDHVTGIVRNVHGVADGKATVIYSVNRSPFYEIHFYAYQVPTWRFFCGLEYWLPRRLLPPRIYFEILEQKC